MIFTPFDPAAALLVGALISPPRPPAMSTTTTPIAEKTYQFAASNAEEVENLAHDERLALLAISVAGQQAAGFRLHLDIRQFPCPTCGAPGFNSGWGYVRFTCGAEVMNNDEGDFCEPCGGQVAA